MMVGGGRVWLPSWAVVLGALALVGGISNHDAAAQAPGYPYRVFAIQVASTPTPIGARCNDHTFHEYTGPATCADHGGVHYWVYPGNR